MKQKKKRPMIPLMALSICLAAGCSSDTQNSVAVVPGRVSGPPFEMPTLPEGTVAYTGDGFQLFVPDDWITTNPGYDDFVFAAESAENPDVTGKIEVIKDVPMDVGYEQLMFYAESRLSLVRGFDFESVKLPDSVPLTLADGTHAAYTVAEFVNEDTNLRACHHHLFALVDENSEVLWWVRAEVSGPLSEESTALDSPTNQRVAICLKSFVPAPPAE